jgi:tetratricopeptide (TPR) repeat protein
LFRINKLGYLVFILLILETFFSYCVAEELEYQPDDSLQSCISAYRDGFYARAIHCIDRSLPDLTTHQDSIEAYKMLAQSYGMMNQIENAKSYFGLVLEKGSEGEIDTLALPPNIAIIYNQVLLEKRVTQIEKNAVPGGEVFYQKKRNAAVPFLLSSVILSTGGAVYLYYNGYLARHEYSTLGKNQDMLDKKWKEFTYSIAGGIGCSVISGVTTLLFFRVINKNSKVAVYGSENGMSITYNF